MQNRQLHFREIRPDVEAHLDFIKNNPHPISLLLDGLGNQRNIASICRTADAARIKHIYGFGMPDLDSSNKFQRIARNTTETVPYSVLENLDEIEKIKEEKEIVALEITTQSIRYTEYNPQKECVLVIGNEQRGVSAELLALVDHSIHIPMHGLNTSMNVAVATGIAVFEILRKLT